MEQTLTVAGTRSPDLPAPGPIVLTLRQGGNLVPVLAGVPTTAADLFEGTDVTIGWKYTRATRAGDRYHLPVLGSGNFPVEPGDVLWVVAPRALTVQIPA